MRQDRIAEVAARLDWATAVTVLTGAGVSAPSGVPTFRGPQGLWKTHRPEDLATPGAFAADPDLVWEWYDWRRQCVASCEPNDGHRVLARWSHQPAPCTVVTQNVDGLHERADTANVIRFHGSIWEFRCWRRCKTPSEPWWNDTVPLLSRPPRCPDCGGLARPGVVWFGEPIDPVVVRQSLTAAQCDIFLTVGTSAVVYPAASLVHAAKAHGAFTVEINLETTPASPEVDLALEGSADEVLDAIDAARRRSEPRA